jgi:hypothetical protein
MLSLSCAVNLSTGYVEEVVTTHDQVPDNKMQIHDKILSRV